MLKFNMQINILKFINIITLKIFKPNIIVSLDNFYQLFLLFYLKMTFNFLINLKEYHILQQFLEFNTKISIILDYCV
jgi:hypothetical protein